MSQIEVHNLSRSFRVSERLPGVWGAVKGLAVRKHRTVTALDDVSFSLDQGELVGYIGPNGAGKSTTVKILSGILVPDSGECTVLGRTPWKSRVAHVREIGVVFGQKTQLWWDLPVVESFDLLRSIYRVPERSFNREKGDLVEMLDLGGLLDTPVRQLSLGQRMRCDLAASLIHSPSILFLDEPTIGLDAISKLAVRSFIKRLNAERKVTVILTTHDMDDIEALCSRVILIGGGRILLDGPLSLLRAEATPEKRMSLDLEDAAPTIEIPGVRVIESSGARLCLSYNPSEIPTAELVAAVASRCSVRDLTVEDPPIEEVIARLYRSYRE